MLLMATCEICLTKFPVEMVAQSLIYTDGNKRVQLKSHDQDCLSCIEEVEKAKEATRQQIKARKAL